MEQSEIRRIGRILKERRLQLGYTQEYAAEKAGISYSYYTKIERGQQLPSLEVAMVLSKTFSLSMDRWLLCQAHDYRMSPAALNSSNMSAPWITKPSKRSRSCSPKPPW